MSTSTLPDVDRTALGLPDPGLRDPVRGWRTARARLLAWLWRHRYSLAVVVPILAGVAALRLWGVGNGPALSDDEGTYVAQAWAVQHLHALAPYTYWYDHPPLGWLQISAFTWATGMFGGSGLAVVAVRRLMVAYAVADGGLLYVLARRLSLPRWAAAAATVAWGLSPLAVGYSRMVYLDNVGMPWVLAAFVLAATRRRSLWSQVAAGICFAVGVLSKETMLLLLPGLLLLVVQHTARRTRAFCLAGFGAATALALAAYPLLAVLKGELLPGPGHVSLLQAWQFQLFTRPSTGSLLVAGTGSRAILDGWLALDGWLLLLGLVALPVCIVRRPLRPVGVALGVLLVAGIRPGYLPTPYVIAFLPFCALGAAATAAVVWSRARPRLALALPIVLVTALAASLLGTAWWHGDAALARSNPNAPTLAAERWLEAHEKAPAGASGSTGNVLVDDTMWVDLVTHGFPRRSVIWFYKLDFVANLDPSVRRRISTYRDFRIVLSTPVIRSQLAASGPASYAIVRQALAHSTVLATFGDGGDRVQVRAVTDPLGTPPSTNAPTTTTTTRSRR